MLLLSLPPEILTQIFLNLEWHDLLRAQSICKAVGKLCSSTALQYHLLLGIAGYEDVSNHPMPISQRLELLKKVEFSFNYANFGQKERFSFEGGPISSHDLQDGIYIQGRRGRHQNETIRADVHQLPSSFSDINDSRSWKLPNFEKPIQNLTLDPKQDLLILIEDISEEHQRVLLHFKSLTTGEPHPLSSGSYVAQTKPGVSTDSGSIIAVMGPFVGLLCDYQIYTICNWKTGKTHMELSTTPDDEIDSFFFLDYDQVGLIRGQRSPAEIEMCKFGTCDDIPQSTELVAKYLLPFDGRLRYLRVICRSDPPPMTTIGTSTALGSNLAYSNPPFVPRMEDRIIVMNISLSGDEIGIQSYPIVIRGETLMTIPEGAKYTDGTYLIPSELWMHQTFSEPTLFNRANYACFVYGSRLVKMTEDPIFGVTFLDFNPRLVAWAKAKGCNTTPYADGCDKPFNRWILESVEPSDRATWGERTSKRSVIATRFVTERLRVEAWEAFSAMLDGERFIAIYVGLIPLANSALMY
ncbi:hypothetical protein FRC17_006229 [Serendipita sp. 399]|nr:hypothetical protein FRC17_006229 [Serendipita sp. 399]